MPVRVHVERVVRVETARVVLERPARPHVMRLPRVRREAELRPERPLRTVRARSSRPPTYLAGSGLPSPVSEDSSPPSRAVRMATRQLAPSSPCRSQEQVLQVPGDRRHQPVAVRLVTGGASLGPLTETADEVDESAERYAKERTGEATARTGRKPQNREARALRRRRDPRQSLLSAGSRAAGGRRSANACLQTDVPPRAGLNGSTGAEEFDRGLRRRRGLRPSCDQQTLPPNGHPLDARPPLQRASGAGRQRW